MATELSSGAIINILEAVPGIATVLRSPVADAIVNLSRAGAGIIPFDKKDAHELIRYAVRRGLIRSDEGDRVAAEIDAAVKSAARAAPSHPAAQHRPSTPKRKPPRSKPLRKKTARRAPIKAKKKK